MTAGTAGVRVAQIALAVACASVGAFGPLAAPADGLRVDVVAPPLTRVESLGDRPIGAGFQPPGGAPPGARPGAPAGPPMLPPPAGLPPPPSLAPPPGGGPPPADPRGHTLRVLVEADAIALAALLGDDAVARALAERESLSARYGETAVWGALVARLAAPPAP